MLDFRNLSRDFNIPIMESGHHHCHEGWIQTHCPFCAGGTHGWHLGFSLEKGNFNCWRCGSHRVWDVLTSLLKDDLKAKRALANYNTDRLPYRNKPQPVPRGKMLWTPENIKPMGKAHHKYLSERCFDSDLLEEVWELKGTGFDSGSWNWRICFPIKDRDGKSVAYMGRSIGALSRPKYKLSDKKHIQADPRSLLYGIHHVRNSVVIVEGPTDVWRLGPGAVAVMGIDWKTEQAVLLKDIPNRYIMFDPEPQAQKKAQELGDWLGMYSGNTTVINELETDPGEMTQVEADSLMRELKIFSKKSF